MCRYEVRIDGAEFEQTFSLDELLDNGFLDDEDPNIQVRAKGESRWVTAREYPYAEKENGSTLGFTVNEDGSITRTSKKTKSSRIETNSNFRVNEDGSVTRRNAPTIPSSSASSSSSNSSSSSSSSSRSSNSSSSSSSGNSGCMQEIWEWVVAIIIGGGIALLLSNL